MKAGDRIFVVTLGPKGLDGRCPKVVHEANVILPLVSFDGTGATSLLGDFCVYRREHGGGMERLANVHATREAAEAARYVD